MTDLCANNRKTETDKKGVIKVKLDKATKDKLAFLAKKYNKKDDEVKELYWK